jgi:rhodanese-related sulfurtransferase
VHRECDPLGAEDAVREGAVLLDVREPDEFAAGHAPGATELAVGELEGRLAELPTGTTIVCVCRSGVRSASAADLLVRAGFDAVNLVGGMLAWAAEGLPVVTNSGAPGTVL